MGLSRTVPAPAGRVVTAFPRRAGQLVAILALIAGILGMHVITVNHSMHIAAAATASPKGAAHTSSAIDSHDGHDGHRAAGGHPHPALEQDATAQPPEPCPGTCHSIRVTAASCTLSATGGTMSAPLPGSTVFGAIPDADHAGSVPRPYSYLPGSPTPGELSISRT